MCPPSGQDGKDKPKKLTTAQKAAKARAAAKRNKK